MEFTGERYIPSEAGQIKYEHLHRYALCMPLVSGKIVLDLASGEGYGAALMADVAERVVGVDISEEAVAEANHRYYEQNLTFLVGNCAQIPLPDASVEVVTSFETIEHHDQHDEMLQEIKRVLRPGGTLIISSPNRLTYSDEPRYSNPFHVKELYFDEFNALLGRYFKHVFMYGQRLATASFVYSLKESEQTHLTSYQGDVDRLVQRIPCLPSPIYFVSVCSDDAVRSFNSNSIYIDASDDLLRKSDVERLHASSLLQEHADIIEQLKQYQHQLEHDLQTLNNQLSEANTKFTLHTQELTRVRDGYETQIERDKLELREARLGYETQIKRLEHELAQERSSHEARVRELEARFTELRVKNEKELAAVKAFYESRSEEQKKEFEVSRNEWSSLLNQRESSLKAIGAQLSATESQLSAAKSELSASDARVSAAEARAHVIRADLGRTQAELQKRDEILLWIETSRAWRWSWFLRRLFDSRGARWLRRGLQSSHRSGLRSSLDFPTDGVDVISRLRIEGWAFSRAPITRVEAFVDNFYLGKLRYGLERRDVVDVYPGVEHANCGFSDLIELPPALFGERKLLVRIYDEHGNLQLHSRSVRVQPTESSRISFAVSNARKTDDSNSTQPVTRENKVDPVFSEFSELLETFKSRIGREPSILDLGVNLNLASAFPEVAIFSPVEMNSHNTLPYLDRSIDLVLVSPDDPEWLEEAHRLAAVAVVRVLPSGTENSNGSGQLQSARSASRLSTYWQEQARVESAQQPTATVSIIIPVYNESSYTSNCLEQLRRTVPTELCNEVIVIDDASTDDTEALLVRWAAEEKRIKIIRNERNLGFIKSCNRGAESATGDFLVFLNNDTLPQPGWLPPLLRVMQEKPKAGAVGGKLIYPDGTLQEAGGVIFADGTGCNFGRNFKFANSPLFSFLREVDYCSGALLATPRELFLHLGGFDTHFAPAYYEDTDYCFRLRELGYVVYYQPESVIVHFEGITSGTSIEHGVKSYQEVNRSRFIERWKQVLKRHPTAPAEYDFATLQLLSIRGEPRNGNSD